MTIHYPKRPPIEAAHRLLAAPGPLPAEAAPTPPTTPDPGPNDEYIRHILIGSPDAIRETIYLLQARHYVDHAQWSGPFPVGDRGIRITRQEGQMLAYLMRRRALDIPWG